MAYPNRMLNGLLIADKWNTRSNLDIRLLVEDSYNSEIADKSVLDLSASLLV